ncbi:MAG: hypothetical protein A2161_22205 [Candidatus Schekmanbacteria bacterium RBG_13_48_7]|uniref:Glycosyltransferase 2-like domain-containing protein n=1 Tax=Candidatus Schekmanbacteria bacterium RBG_13_48_7 TaxID=1817878 RepID=A0A1F7RZZ5_9BACT|nr:MAG: hypothetical protein A2161_22205 [Candidatus Schekmanbacteria bacterium RBG_13_48_7]
MKYSVVIPLFNEEENIRILYSKLKSVLNNLQGEHEIIYIDDGSDDRTFLILEEITNSDSSVHVIKLRKNFGQTAALAAGFDFATGDTIISMDGDLQHDPEDIPKLVEKLHEGYEVVSGWRKTRKDNLLTRRFPSFIANKIVASISGIHIHDFGTTLKAYRKEFIKKIYLYPGLHRFIPALEGHGSIRIAEVPIKNIVRQKGRSNYGLSRVFRVILDLLIIKYLVSYANRPLHFFGLLGLILFFIGTICLASGLFIKNLTAVLILATLFVSMGMNLLVIGILAELLLRFYSESTGKKIYAIDIILNQRISDS